MCGACRRFRWLTIRRLRSVRTEDRNRHADNEQGIAPYKLQAEPARKLKNLKGIPIVVVTSEGSFASPGNPGAVAFFKQAGCTAEELRLVDHGIHGNGHMMMVEKNNAEVLEPIVAWIEKNVPKTTHVPMKGRNADPTDLKLSEQGFSGSV
jgi:hypothetical protein